MFMKNWDTTDEFGFCQSDKDAEESEWICKQLDIPFHVVSIKTVGQWLQHSGCAHASLFRGRGFDSCLLLINRT